MVSKALPALIVLLLSVGLLTMAHSGGEVWKDPASGLTWQVQPADKKLNWEKAKAYCQNLKLGGHSDWHLPTASELRSLLRGCPQTVNNGACRVNDECLGHGCWNESCAGCALNGGPGPNGAYWPAEMAGENGWYWSSSAVGRSVNGAWLFSFHYASIVPSLTYGECRVRCVRN